MAENKFISELSKATELKNEAQFVIEQDGLNKRVSGEQVKEFVGELLPINDNYSVLNNGEFVDLFGRGLTNSVSKYSELTNDGLSKYLPFFIAQSSELLGGKYFASISFAPNSLNKIPCDIGLKKFTNLAEYTALGTDFRNYDIPLYRITPLEEDYDKITTYRLDGTDTRVEILADQLLDGNMCKIPLGYSLGFGIYVAGSDVPTPFLYTAGTSDKLESTFGNMYVTLTTAGMSSNGFVIGIETVDENYSIEEVASLDNRLKNLEKSISSYKLPLIFNHPIRRRTIDTPLRVVLFGSSWFMNCWWYLNHIIKEAGINAELYGFYTGGAYFEQWNDRWDNNTSIDCWTSTNGSEWVKGTAPFRTTIEDNMDIIGFQQGARQAPFWVSYWDKEWAELVSKIKRSCGLDTVIGFNSTFCPAAGSVDLDGLSQREWQQLNYSNTERFIYLSGLYESCPNGANMWAMRSSPSLNTGGDLANDGIHPNNGLPMYGLAACYYQTFIAPMYGVSIEDISWLPTTSTPKAVVSGSNWTDISEEQRLLIVDAIKMAQGDRFGFPEF